MTGALLRLLLRLDNLLYRYISLAAVRYGGGLHPKHRLTAYHDFFARHIAADERVLDIGCGNGVVDFDVVTRTGAFVTGVDRDAAAIAQAQAHYRHGRLRFRVGDAWDVLAGEAFDVVVLSNVLEHLDDRVEFLRRVREQIGPRRVLVRVPLFERDWRVPLKAELGVDHRLDPTHRTEYRESEFRDELARAGFAVVEAEIRWGEIWAVGRPTSE
jgi:SAM-dependent methyltransferase